MNLKIHPSVGVARLGNSPNEICLSPDRIGGLPFEADSYGNLIGPIKNFKDSTGRIKRQGQPFKIFSDDGSEITLSHPDVLSIDWTVHLANKKAEWYQYSELQGNLLYGVSNSYTNQNIQKRNAEITENRQTLFIDPGPRNISGKQQNVSFDKASAPANYPVQYPTANPKYGVAVKTLGN